MLINQTSVVLSTYFFVFKVGCVVDQPNVSYQRFCVLSKRSLLEADCYATGNVRLGVYIVC